MLGTFPVRENYLLKLVFAGLIDRERIVEKFNCRNAAEEAREIEFCRVPRGQLRLPGSTFLVALALARPRDLKKTRKTFKQQTKKSTGWTSNSLQDRDNYGNSLRMNVALHATPNDHASLGH